MPDRSGTDFRKDFAEPAVNATLAILKAALSVPQIKKVIVMSSSVALLPVSVLARPDLEYEVKGELFARLTGTLADTNR